MRKSTSNNITYIMVDQLLYSMSRNISISSVIVMKQQIMNQDMLCLIQCIDFLY